MMALEFLGRDPESDDGGSPAVWLDQHAGDYILRGWTVHDEATKAQTGENPKGETLIRFPARMTQFLLEVNGGGTDRP